jgi:glutathione peroxidase
MKRLLGFFVLLCVLTSFKWAEDIYSITFNDIQGNKIDLNDYKGRKLLFVILPFMDQDSAAINQITDFQKDHVDSLIVIGILSKEFGYTDEKKTNIRKMYVQDRNSGIILTAGMNVKKESTQSLLLSWLTSKESNKRFNNDIIGIGYKFFVDEAGKLYGVIGPEVSLSNPIFSKILSKPFVN